jgi:two-component system response regulator QseB
VLVVEDDSHARKAVTRILRLKGFAPFEAATVSEALEELRRLPDWVLLDLMLPDGCGSEVLERVAADRMETRVCVITGCTGPLLDRVRRMGAEQVLTKPLNVDVLIALLGGESIRQAS